MNSVYSKKLQKIISPDAGDYNLTSQSCVFYKNEEEKALEKYNEVKNVNQKIRGCFKKCMNSGIITRNDREKYDSMKFKSIMGLIFCISYPFCFYSFNKTLFPINLTYLIGGSAGFFVLISASRYLIFCSSCDAKYSAVFLNSIGRKKLIN